MQALTDYETETSGVKSTNLRVNVTFDVSLSNNTEAGAAAFAKAFQEALKGNHQTLLTHLQSKPYKVKVQARRNRKPKNKTV